MKALRIIDSTLLAEPMNPYMKVPVDLCEYAFKVKELKAFRVYVLLSALTQGNILISKMDEIVLCSMLGYKTNKSLHNQISRLTKMNWIGFDPSSKKYWIRGFDELRKTLDLKNRKAVEFGIEFIESFDSFCFSAIVGRIIIRQVWWRRLARMKSGSAFQDLPSKPGYCPIANILIANKLSISISSASRYKKKSVEDGYMEVLSTYRQTPIKKEELASCKINDYESFGKMFPRGGKVVEPGPDLVKVCLTYRRRKKMDT